MKSHHSIVAAMSLHRRGLSQTKAMKALRIVQNTRVQ